MTRPDDAFRIAERLGSGMTCGHILMTRALEARGETEPALACAMSGLALGLGPGFDCGAVSAGCRVLGLHAGRAEAEEADEAVFAVDGASDVAIRWTCDRPTRRRGSPAPARRPDLAATGETAVRRARWAGSLAMDLAAATIFATAGERRPIREGAP